jgi:hypothetical protein
VLSSTYGGNSTVRPGTPRVAHTFRRSLSECMCPFWDRWGADMSKNGTSAPPETAKFRSKLALARRWNSDKLGS